MNNDHSENIDPGILELERMIGVKSGFFAHLQQEDDWSFVIKLHALFEAACTHLLLYHFKEPKLAEVIARIDLSGRPVGKSAMLGHLELLGKRGRQLLSQLSELRNSLVHDVRHSEFSLDQYVGSLTPEALKVFAVAFSPTETAIRKFMQHPILGKGLTQQLINQSTIESVVRRAQQSPKFHIWLGAYGTLTTLVDMYSYSDYQQWEKARSLNIEDEEDDVNHKTQP